MCRRQEGPPIDRIMGTTKQMRSRQCTSKLTVVQEVAERPSSWPPSALRAVHRPERPVLLAVEEHETARQQQRGQRGRLVVAAAAAAGLAGAVEALGGLEGLASLGQAVAAAEAEALRDNHQDTPWLTVGFLPLLAGGVRNLSIGVRVRELLGDSQNLTPHHRKFRT